MAEQRTRRRLAAILAADVVGYGRLMEQDEAGTLAALKSRRRQVLEPLLARHQGRVFKVTGDGVLVEFGSAVNAVQCAVELQQAMAAANGDQPKGHRIVLRIGVNLGDVMIEDGDRYGDGVNIAARLEQLAEPGGILVSGTTYDQVRNKIKASFDDLGPQTLKNIAEPARAYRVKGLPPAATTASRPVTDKPSIAVLPFLNLSDDPEQEYFADGIAEDIITALSRFHWFLVIARNSSFTYKGRTVDVKEVAHDLGVRYVIEGSVRRAGNRVRVAAQLIDAGSGVHLWAERYDRDLGDIFLVQDEITQSIVASIAPEFESAEIRRASRPDGRVLTVWDLVMQARWHLGMYNRESCAKARLLLLEATALDDRNPQAYCLLAMTHWMQSIYRWSESTEQSGAAALQAARRAVLLDGGDAMAQAALGIALTLEQRHDEAIETLDRAVRLNPNLASAYGWLGIACAFACDFRRGVEAARQAMKLSPRDLDRPFWMAALSFAALAESRYEEVIDLTTTMLREKPDLPTALRHRAAALALLGREAEARAVIDRLLNVAPDTTISQVRRVFSIRDPEIERRWLEGLRRAGLPE
ncbi:MAG TPA: adenylate/guanylate cyclase domain-containing protein [Alphaproteobacteria bacterium]|nr:adenylate/guanylate cyclase domain-containing protein [Alphaproteobacteria bacterium]